MSINWFPGHMNKTLKQMQNDARICDCFIYVVDARCPQSCINPEFVKVVKNKPIIFVLNKADLVEKTALKQSEEKLKLLGQECVSLNATISGNAKVIVAAIKRVLANKLKQNQMNPTWIQKIKKKS